MFLRLPIDHQQIFGTENPTVEQWKEIRELYGSLPSSGSSEDAERMADE